MPEGVGINTRSELEIGWKEGGIKVVKKDDTAPVLSLEFDSKPSVSGQVRKLLPTIEHYKSQEGYSLRQIYDALQAKDYIQCAWPSFQNTYYRVRKEAEDARSPEEATQSSKGETVRWQSPSEGRSQPLSPSKPPRKKIEISPSKRPLSGGLDLAAHQAKARAVFDLKSLP